jgi:hypothetical protein
VHRVFVPKRLGKLFRKGIRVLASCSVNCQIFLEVRLSDETAAQLGVPNVVLARGTRVAAAGQKRWIVAKFKRRARRLLAFAGGGSFEIDVRGVGPGGEQFSTTRSSGL